jgi:hypothetical protein
MKEIKNKGLELIFRELKEYLDLFESPVNFKIYHVLRTKAEQFELYKKGRTLKRGKWMVTGKIVTYNDGSYNKSKHQEGKAVDIIATFNGRLTWDIDYYYYLAGLIEYIAFKHGIGIKWGGWFKRKDGSRFVDGGHFELTD